MQFGLWYDFRNPPQWQRPWPQLYGELLDQIVYAEGLGYDYIWLSEHHFSEDGYLPSLLPMAAAIAARTKRVKIGTAVLLTPLHHALRVAEDGAVVDLISNGRLVLGVGLGWHPMEFAALGVPIKQRASRADESIEVIKRAWTEERFSFHGRYYRFENLSVTPKPVQRPRPPILIGGSSEEAVRRAARLGDGFIGGGGGSGRQLVELYQQALQEAGRSRAEVTIAMTLPLYVSDDPERDWQRIRDHVLYQANWYRQGRGPAIEDPDVLRPGFIIADAERCAEAVRRRYEETGCDELHFWAVLPGMAPGDAQASIERFAKEVIPRVRSAVRPSS